MGARLGQSLLGSRMNLCQPGGQVGGGWSRMALVCITGPLHGVDLRAVVEWSRRERQMRDETQIGESP